MYYVILLIKLFLFIISNIGIWEFLQNKKINIYFIPSLTIAIQVSFLFLAGLLNLLKEMTVLLWGIGIFLFIYYFIKKKRFGKELVSVGFVYLGIVMVIMLLLVRGSIVTHYDNFSHWALVVKRMLEVNHFPNFTDTIITFQEYPLGSAIYIYYFSKLTNHNESFWMLAQIYMIVSCILPIFIFQKKNKIISSVLIFIMTFFFLGYNIKIFDLLVDTLLPIVAMCMLVYVYMYCKKIEDTFAFFSCVFYFIWISQIKNSALFFVLVAILFILISVKNDKKLRYRLAVATSPFVSIYLWGKHCKYVFMAASTSKHAMTFENYKNIVGGKTIEDMKNIASSMFQHVTMWRDVKVVFCVLIVAAIIIYICSKRKKVAKNRVIKLLVFSVGLYALYQVGVLGMYLFSMPLGEAMVLAGINRYTRTILIAILYVIVIAFVYFISEFEVRNVGYRVGVCTMFFTVGIMYWMIGGKIDSFIQCDASKYERLWLEKATYEYAVPRGCNYCILKDYDDAGYSYFLGRYLLQSSNVKVINVSCVEDLEDVPSGYIYVYSRDNPIIKEWVSKKHPNQIGEDVIVRE